MCRKQFNSGSCDTILFLQRAVFLRKSLAICIIKPLIKNVTEITKYRTRYLDTQRTTYDDNMLRNSLW